MENHYFEDDWMILFSKFLKDKGLDSEFDSKKRKLIFYIDDHNKIFELRLSTNLNFEFGSKNLSKSDFVNYVIILVRSGMASVGMVQNQEMLDHKVFRAYMVRKKQGKSQIKYLKTKGKSRAGSRVRLAETEQFFKKIAERVKLYIQTYPIDQIGVSCSETLIPYLFNESNMPFLKKKDSRLFKIPKHIATPTLENLELTKAFLEKNQLIIYPEGKSFFLEFLSKLDENERKLEEDW